MYIGRKPPTVLTRGKYPCIELRTQRKSYKQIIAGKETPPKTLETPPLQTSPPPWASWKYATHPSRAPFEAPRQFALAPLRFPRTQRVVLYGRGSVRLPRELGFRLGQHPFPVILLVGHQHNLFHASTSTNACRADRTNVMLHVLITPRFQIRLAGCSTAQAHS